MNDHVSEWKDDRMPKPPKEGLHLATRMQKRRNYTLNVFEYQPKSKHFFVDGVEVDEAGYRAAAAERNIPVGF